jgi:hypothetical protein
MVQVFTEQLVLDPILTFSLRLKSMITIYLPSLNLLSLSPDHLPLIHIEVGGKVHVAMVLHETRRLGVERHWVTYPSQVQVSILRLSLDVQRIRISLMDMHPMDPPIQHHPFKWITKLWRVGLHLFSISK